MTDLENAKLLLYEGGFTSVICRGDTIYKSTARGVAPILSLIDDGKLLSGFSAADKVIGRAAAMLLYHAGVRNIYGAVMSRPAADFLEKNGVDYSLGELCDRITNRSGDGYCPMELAVMDISEPEMALAAVRKRLSELRQGG